MLRTIISSEKYATHVNCCEYNAIKFRDTPFRFWCLLYVKMERESLIKTFKRTTYFVVCSGETDFFWNVSQKWLTCGLHMTNIPLYYLQMNVNFFEDILSSCRIICRSRSTTRLTSTTLLAHHFKKHLFVISFSRRKFASRLSCKSLQPRKSHRSTQF